MFRVTMLSDHGIMCFKKLHQLTVTILMNTCRHFRTLETDDCISRKTYPITQINNRTEFA
jgi:hypothetical protein